MAHFLRNWLTNQRNEHQTIVNRVIGGNNQNQPNQNQPQPTPSQTVQPSISSSSTNDPPPSSSSTAQSFASPDEVIYESNDLRLVVKKMSFKRQKNFKIQDMQFWLRIIPLRDQENPPLIEILDFLEEGFNFILQQIKNFFKPNEHRIGYLTLYQEPMVIF